MAAVKPYLSRQYVYAPLAQLNVDLGDAEVHRVAFMSDPAAEPGDEDWVEAIPVTQGHSLYDPSIGDALAVLVGPDRGEDVESVDLEPGRYLMWSDWRIAGSDERPVDWHGTVEVVSAPGEYV